jgi:hypothetical protein
MWTSRIDRRLSAGGNPSHTRDARPELPADPNLNSDIDEVAAAGYLSDGATTNSSDSYHPESGSVPKRKQSARRPQGARTEPKRAKSQKEKQVSSSPYHGAFLINSQKS